VTNQTGAAPKQTSFAAAFSGPAFSGPAFTDPAFTESPGTDALPPARGRRRIAARPGLESAGGPAGKSARKSAHKSPRLCDRRATASRVKQTDRQPPLNYNEAGGDDPVRSLQKSDLAFQHAMRRAIARGLECPPAIGVIKDHRPLTVPRLFEPVPHASGCTSPALECAELAAPRAAPGKD
jgi:hypothetical protein